MLILVIFPPSCYLRSADLPSLPITPPLSLSLFFALTPPSSLFQATGPLLDFVWNEEDPDAAIGRYSYVVGAVRFRQKRNLFVDCASLGVVGPVSALVTQQCLDPSLQNRSVYGPDASFSFNEASGFHVSDITGADAGNAMEQIHALMHGMWIDSATKLVEVLLSVYNAQLDAMLSFTFRFTVPVSSEGLRPSSQIHLINWSSSGPWAIFVTLMEVVLIIGSFVATPYLLFRWWEDLTTRFHVKIPHMAQTLLGAKTELVLPSVNVRTAKLFSLFLIDAWSVLQIETFFLKQTTDFSSGRDEFVNLQPLVAIKDTQSLLMSLALVLLWLLLCVDLQLIPILGPMIQAVISTMIHVRVIMFVLFVLFFCFCFAIGCQLYFGYNLEAFLTLDSAVWTIFTDSFDLLEMRSLSGDVLEYHPAGVLFYIVMFVFITLTLLNIFIGLTGEVYGEMYAESSSIWLKEVNDLMEENLLNRGGLKSKVKECKEMPNAEEKCVCSACRRKNISNLTDMREDTARTTDTCAPLGVTRDEVGSKIPTEGQLSALHSQNEARSAKLKPLSKQDYDRLLNCNFPNLMKIDLQNLQGKVPSFIIGLRWLVAGDTEPTTGHNLQDANLAEALQKRTEFTQQEWDAFGIKDLREDHFIKSGNSYFKPDVPVSNERLLADVLIRHAVNRIIADAENKNEFSPDDDRCILFCVHASICFCFFAPLMSCCVRL